ncbi:MAG: hypothetical protein ACYC92_00960 [Candidatus Acidiferrales bacterium]
MSAQDLKALKDASYNMDYGPGQQDAALSYEHGMRDGLASQDPMEAQQQGDAFIARQEPDAQKIQADWLKSGHTGIAPAALTHFGNALHTILDRKSPAHKGNQPWYGQSKWDPSAWLHFLHESYITSTELKDAINAAQQAFRQTFGMDEFDYLQLVNRNQCSDWWDPKTQTLHGCEP